MGFVRMGDASKALDKSICWIKTQIDKHSIPILTRKEKDGWFYTFVHLPTLKRKTKNDR